MNWIKLIAILVGAYLTGSIPIGYIVGKVFYKTDIRSAGSGNIGATNALRLFGTRTGVLILLGDMFKGFISVFVASMLFGEESAIVVLAALFAILGHIFTMFLSFKGGKGVATAAGAFLAMAPLEVAITLIVFIVIVAISKYVSLGSIFAAVCFGTLVALRESMQIEPNWVKAVFCVLIALMIIFKHKANIGRLIKGNENKIRFSKKGSR